MELNIYTSGNYSFYSRIALSDKQIAQLLCALDGQIDPSAGMLGGRAAAYSFPLAGVGTVVLKTYMRGGLWGKIIKRTYLNHGTPRSGLEMVQLLKAARIGVMVPDPLCYITSGSLFYKCWLVMRHVAHDCTLASLACKDEKQALAHMDHVRRQVQLLIDHRIRHVDLHPGNILVGAKGDIYLIDFDKAYQYTGDKEVLARRYTERWIRAVKKYHLPDSINRQMTSLV